MANESLLSTALLIGKALQAPSAPLTVNGVTYDGSQAVNVTVGALPVVASVEDMVDPQQQYVLESTGTVWVHRYVNGYTNRLPTATTEPNGDTVCGGDGVGYIYPYRLEAATGVEKSGGKTYLTGYIPVNGKSVIRIKGIYNDTTVTGAYGNFIFQFKEGGEYAYNASTPTQSFLSISAWTQVDEEGKEWEVTLVNPDARYIRIQCTGMDANAIVTVDEEISGHGESGWFRVDTGVVYGWNDGGMQALEARTAELENQAVDTDRRLDTLEREESDTLPVWWEEYLPDRMAAIRAHQDEGGRDAFSFLVMSDLHESGNIGRRIGAVAKRVMETCGMRFAVDLGDFSTRQCVSTRESMERSMDAAQKMLAPIADRLLRTVGNHDGAWGSDSEGHTYVQHYSDGELYNRVFRSVAIGQAAHFDADGVGYYVDDTAARARFVVLNTHHTKGNINPFNQFRYGQSQFDLMVEALTTMPSEDWVVLFFSHVPPVGVLDYDGDGTTDGDLSTEIPEQGLLRELVTAYSQRSPIFAGSYGTVGTWQYVSLSGIDFSEAKGIFGGYFAGHLHGDMVFGVDSTYPFPVITVRCDAPAEEEKLHSELREACTPTEHSFDAVTVVRTTSGLTLYLDKIGAGEDRTVSVTI